MANKDSWDPEFYPCYTPEEMLKLGVFEGKYINNIDGIPSSWKKLPKVLGPKDKPDESLNHYGVKSRQPLSTWKDNGWIKTDKNGWFEWYCHYQQGRRLGEEDKWQIGRWRSFVARHMGQIKANCKLGDKECRPVQRQGLLQWGWDSSKEFTDAQKVKNLKALGVKVTPTVESLINKW
jgi:hypothetical protein